MQDKAKLTVSHSFLSADVRARPKQASRLLYTRPLIKTTPAHLNHHYFFETKPCRDIGWSEEAKVTATPKASDMLVIEEFKLHPRVEK